jgi:hypothetical protein
MSRISVILSSPDPGSIVSGWNGSGTKSVTVTITNNSSDDLLSVSGATIGSVALKGDFTDSTATFTGSSLSLGRLDRDDRPRHGLGKRQNLHRQNQTGLVPPSTSIFDLVGDACSPSTVTAGSAKQF